MKEDISAWQAKLCFVVVAFFFFFKYSYFYNRLSGKTCLLS